MSRFSSFACLTVSLLAVAACKTTRELEDDSDVRFVANWSPQTCTVAKVDKPAIKACITGGGNVTIARQKTTEALTQWLAPLQARYDGIATKIEFGCDKPDITVNVHPGYGAGFAGPGNVMAVYEKGEIGTWLHEFGHAFACLGDTYVGGTAGACMAGQPKSVMCHGLLIKNLTQDDVNGLLAQYVKLGKPTALVDPEGDADADGVKNAEDLCPNTAAGSEVWVDEHEGKFKGCASGQSLVPLPKPIDPNADDDQDGIPNFKDKCPGTPAGAKVHDDLDGGKWRGCAGGQTPILLPG